MTTPLLQRPHWAAVFKPGRSPLGHHWRLVDPRADDAPLGRTKRVYRNVLLRTVTVTGLDSGNDIRADVFDGDDRVAQVFSAWRTKTKSRTVELRDAQDALLGSSAHDTEASRLLLLDGAGSEVGRLEHEGEDPWPVLDAGGTRIGVLTREPLPLTEYRLLEDLLVDVGPTERRRDFEATFHLGIGGAQRYEVALDPAATVAEPLRTLAAALPLLAAYSY
jgi:hypothetical protein